MRFDTTQYPEMMEPLLVDDAIKDLPVFGDEKKSIAAIASQVLESTPPEMDSILDSEANETPLPIFKEATTTAAKLIALRKHAKTMNRCQELLNSNKKTGITGEGLGKSPADLVVKGTGLTSNRQRHENLLTTTLDTSRFPKSAQIVLDHVMLLRSKERYLFDYRANIDITSDDPWLKELWLWVASMGLLSPVIHREANTSSSGASDAAYDDGMLAQGIDFSFLGVIPIWKRDLGETNTFDNTFDNRINSVSRPSRII